MTILETRDKAMRRAIAEEIGQYIRAQRRDEEPKRECATCGKTFQPRQRYHFFDRHECRAAFYAGVFRPRKRGGR